MAGIRRNETAIKCRRQLLVGKIATDLMTLYDKAPEAREEVTRLFGGIAELIYLYSAPAEDLDEASKEVIKVKIHEIITAKF